MSKIISDLHNLNDTRKMQGGIVVEDSQEEQIQAPVVHQYKGGYLLSILLVVLIGISAYSMSISLKTFTQLETSWADSKAILIKLNQQGKELQILQALITNNTSQELNQIAQLTDQVKTFEELVKSKDQELADMKGAHIDLKNSIENTVKEFEQSVSKLRMSDDLILKKYTLLNQKVSDTVKLNATIYNTY